MVTVNNELGMKQGKDQAAMADIRKRLGQQGVEASNIELFGGMEISDKPKKVRVSLLNILIHNMTLNKNKNFSSILILDKTNR